MLEEMIAKLFRLIEKKESRHWYKGRLTIYAKQIIMIARERELSI